MRWCSGLVLNFVPDHPRMAAEMRRAARPGGTVALYVWDYAVGMELMRKFWDAAIAEDAAAQEFDEGARFSICDPGALTVLFEAAGLREVTSRPIDIPTIFQDFYDYWSPFLGGTGAAPGVPDVAPRARPRRHPRAAESRPPRGSKRHRSPHRPRLGSERHEQKRARYEHACSDWFGICVRIRTGHVRAMFGIEQFCRKLNGFRAMVELLHPEHRGIDLCP